MKGVDLDAASGISCSIPTLPCRTGSWTRSWRAPSRSETRTHGPSRLPTHQHPVHGRKVGPSLRVLTRHALLSYAAKHWPGWHLPILGRIIRTEAKLRRSWARWGGDNEAAELYAELGAIAADV